MGVDGGAGNTISFSEIQTYYGGSNPIALSEYYREGGEVPGTSSASGTTMDRQQWLAASVSTIATATPASAQRSRRATPGFLAVSPAATGT